MITGLRILSRTVLTKFYGLDDALIVFALLVTISYAASSCAAVDAGYGKHYQDISPEARPLAVYRSIVHSSIAVWSYSLPKLAIVALLNRLLAMSSSISITFWSLAIALVGCSSALSAVWYAQCSPREHQWNRAVPGTCLNPRVLENLSYFVVAFSIFLDFLFAAYPIFAVSRLNMARQKRIVISIALSGGFVAGIVAIYKEALVTTISSTLEEDPTCTLLLASPIAFSALVLTFVPADADIPLDVWNIVEANILILVACLPTIGPFVRYVRSSASRLYSRDSTDSGRKHRHNTETLWPGERSAPRWQMWTAGADGTARLPSQQDDIHLVDAKSQQSGGTMGPTESESVHPTPKGSSPQPRTGPAAGGWLDPELGLPEAMYSPPKKDGSVGFLHK